MNNNSSYKGFYQTGLSLTSNHFGQDPIYNRNDLNVKPSYYSSINQSFSASTTGTFQTSQQSYVQDYGMGYNNQSYDNQHYNQSSMDADQASYQNYGLQEGIPTSSYFGQDMVTGSNAQCESTANETTIGDNFSTEQWEQFQQHFQKAFEQQLTHQIHLQLQQQGLYDSRKSGNLSGVTDGMTFGDDSVGKRNDGERCGYDERVRFGDASSSTSRSAGRPGQFSKNSKFFCSTCDVSYANSLAFTSHLGSADHKLRREKEVTRPKVPTQSPLLPPASHHPFPRPEDQQRMAMKRPYEAASAMPRPEEFGVYMDKSKNFTESTESLIGQEFIKEFRNNFGSIVRVVCSLCRFEITNPSEKWRHLRSHQHRNLCEKRMAGEVPIFGQDLKGVSNRPIIKRPPTFILGQRYFQYSNDTGHKELQGQQVGSKETDDDACVRQKHALIYPTPEDFRAIQKTSGSCDRWLKSTMNNLEDSSKQKLISAVFKVGNLAKGLLSHYDLSCDHLVLSRDWPTKELVMSTYKQLEILKEKNTKDDQPEFVLSISEGEDSIILESLFQPIIRCKIHFSSYSVRDAEVEAKADDVSNDRLDKGACLRHLDLLDQIKWFQTKAIPLPSCVLVVRVLKDLRHNNKELHCLTDEVLEILVANSISAMDSPSGPGAVLNKVLELICNLNEANEKSIIDKPGDDDDAGAAVSHDDDKKETESQKEKDNITDEMLRLHDHLTSQEKENVAKVAEHIRSEIVCGNMREVLQINKKSNLDDDFIALDDGPLNGDVVLGKLENNNKTRSDIHHKEPLVKKQKE